MMVPMITNPALSSRLWETVGANPAKKKKKRAGKKKVHDDQLVLLMCRDMKGKSIN